MGMDLKVGDLVHDGELYDKLNSSTADNPFFKKWARNAKGSVLELCCGTGRVTIPIFEDGVDIWGLDYTPSMLNLAKEKALKKSLNMKFIEGDIRDFKIDKKFKLIFIPFNSLQCIYTLKDLELVFKNIHLHLDKDGLFIFDIFNPNIEMMVEYSKELREIAKYNLSDGRLVQIKEKMNYDPVTQCNRVRWHLYIDGEEHIEQLDMRCFYPLEMDSYLKYNNFNIIHKFGDFHENPFQSQSMKQIYVCKSIK